MEKGKEASPLQAPLQEGTESVTNEARRDEAAPLPVAGQVTAARRPGKRRAPPPALEAAIGGSDEAPSDVISCVLTEPLPQRPCLFAPMRPLAADESAKKRPLMQSDCVPDTESLLTMSLLRDSPVDEAPSHAEAPSAPSPPAVAAPSPEDAPEALPTQTAQEGDEKRASLDGEDYHITVRPVMGPPFTIVVPPDSTVYDVKDFIFTKVGLAPENQVLGHLTLPISFNEEDAFLADLMAPALPRTLSITLSIRGATGLYGMVDPFYGGEEEAGEDGCTTASCEVVSCEVHFGPPPASSSPDEEWSDGGDAAHQNASSQRKQGGRATMLCDGKVIITHPMGDGTSSTLPAYLCKAVLDEVHRHQQGAGAGLPLAHRISMQVEGLEALRITTTPPPPPADGNRGAFDVSVRLVTAPCGGPRDTLEEASGQPGGAGRAPPPPPERAIEGRATEDTGRCGQCNRRCRPALKFTCKCGGTFCQEHRYYDAHGCAFDVKGHERRLLDRANPRVCHGQLDRL